MTTGTIILFAGLLFAIFGELVKLNRQRRKDDDDE